MASNRSSRVIKVINVVVNKLSPLFGLVIYFFRRQLDENTKNWVKKVIKVSSGENSSLII